MNGRAIEIVVDDDPSRIVAERLAQAAKAGESLVLTGGSSPRHAYELAVALQPDWTRNELWWGDERCVPPEDERSNFRLAQETLLSRLHAPPLAVHRIPGELGPKEGAENYERELGHMALDLVLLGLGPDGHVASLFPNQATLAERDRRVLGAEAHLEPFVDRITLTLPALNGAGEVVFLVTGEAKADAVVRAFLGEPDPGTPGSLARSTIGRTWAAIDPAAASRL